MRRRLTRSRGQSLVEFAIAIPLLAVMLGLTVDLGRGYSIGSQVSNAAREGALFAAHHAETETSLASLETDVKTVINNEEQASPAVMKCPNSLTVTFSFSPTSSPSIPLASGSANADTMTLTVTCQYTDFVNISPDGGHETSKTTVETYLAD